ncbi:methyltransferase domain-containing protein [Actinomyces sp. HMT897]|uniref:methyltransferase domain-containing protein n=1 Tax=Actinomyces sp. HMT897 TaxID=2789424 RepID=UPI0019091858|nr:methyltransferase domain-containing protein [Actinomyces sp. HMT897]QQO78785.1 methyltransferase domain-containing protein [Actinomyces sp. HMT897]
MGRPPRPTTGRARSAPSRRVLSRRAPSRTACSLHDAGACRSCPDLARPLPEQLAAKQAQVAGLLADGPAPVPRDAWLPPAGSAPTGFRNKAKMAVSGSVSAPVLGLADRFGGSLDLRGCPLHVDAIQESLPVLGQLVTGLGLAPYHIATDRGELKYLLLTASPTGALMVRWVLRSHRHVGTLRRALPRIRRALPQLEVMSANIQPVRQAVLEGEEEILLGLAEGMSDRLQMDLLLPAQDVPGRPGGRKAEETVLPLLLPTRSFFQTNTAVAEELYATARQWAAQWASRRRADAGWADAGRAGTGWMAGGRAGADAGRAGAGSERGAVPLHLWDLFCGVGGFALALASHPALHGAQVRGVELSASAIHGAQASARLMGLDPRRVWFEAGDARVLDPRSGDVPDLLVVNPPRRGIGPDLAQRIEASGVRRVLYSSCNPSSLVSDLAAMPSLRVRRARLFDMFPHTGHAEVLVELGRSGSGGGRDGRSRGLRAGWPES